MLKYILAFVGGAAAGSGICYFVMKKKGETKLRKKVSEMEEFYKNRKKYEAEEAKAKEEAEKLEKKRQEAFDRSELLNNVKAYSSFSKIAPNLEETPKEQGEVEENMEEKEEEISQDFDDAPIEKRDEPYFITPDEYMNGASFYDKVELTYFENDNVLIEDDEEVVSPWDILGTDFAKGFDMYEKDTCYIRNDKIACDYLINLEHASYYNDAGYYKEE